MRLRSRDGGGRVWRALSGYSTDMQRDIDIDIDRTSHAQHERELLAELRSSFVFVIVTVGILFFASVVGVAIS